MWAEVRPGYQASEIDLRKKRRSAMHSFFSVLRDYNFFSIALLSSIQGFRYPCAVVNRRLDVKFLRVEQSVEVVDTR